MKLRLPFVPNSGIMSSVQNVADVVETELLSGDHVPNIDNIHRSLGARCRLTHEERLREEWSRLQRRVECMCEAIDDLNDAMEVASEYGYSWERLGWYEYDAPYVGDAKTTEYMSPFVQEFSELYVTSCVFMTRKGQRSQLVHHDSLNSLSGRTRVQERHAQVVREMRKRQREEKVQKAQEEEEARKRRREELEARIREAQAEMSSLA